MALQKFLDNDNSNKQSISRKGSLPRDKTHFRQIANLSENAKRLLDAAFDKIYSLKKGKQRIDEIESVKKSYQDLIEYYESRGDEYGLEKIRKLEAEFEKLLKEDKKQTINDWLYWLVRIIVELIT